MNAPTPRPRTVHCFVDDALGDRDAVGLAAALRSGEVGRAEVLEAAVARVRRVDLHLDAVQVEGFDLARRAPATEGAFAGVPAFVKDNVDVAGLPTCHGSAAFRPRPARRSSAPAEQFLATGVTVLGKSRMPEFGLTASTEYVDRPPARNPWHTGHSVGASSGGSAALVASGAVPIAHANDGGGSIRIPAAAAGLVGLKPTRARLLDQPGVRQLPVNLVCEGVVTRTVRDTAHYLAAAERFRPNPAMAPVGLVEGPSPRRLRVGVVRADVLGRPAHPDVLAAVDSAASALGGLGHEVVDARLDASPQFVDDFTTYWALLGVLLTVSHQAASRAHFDRTALDPFTRGLAARLRRHPLAVPGAVRRLRGGVAVYDAHFREVDVLLTPVLSHPAPEIGELSPQQPADELLAKLVDFVGFTPLNNVGGGPGIAVPHGTLPGGLPGSVQLSAPRGGERVLLELAYELEAESPFPDIRALAGAVA